MIVLTSSLNKLANATIKMVGWSTRRRGKIAPNLRVVNWGQMYSPYCVVVHGSQKRWDAKERDPLLAIVAGEVMDTHTEGRYNPPCGLEDYLGRVSKYEISNHHHHPPCAPSSCFGHRPMRDPPPPPSQPGGPIHHRAGWRLAVPNIDNDNGSPGVLMVYVYYQPNSCNTHAEPAWAGGTLWR